MNASNISVSPNPYRILSLDGGGSWALIQARALGRLFGDDIDGQTILSKFNLVVANSGGSLVLAALATGRTPRQIYDLFLEDKVRESLFVSKRRTISRLAGGFIPKYLAARKLDGLRNLLNKTAGPNGGLVSLADVPLNKIPEKVPLLNETRLLIVGFDYDRERADFFRSHDTKFAPTLAEAAHASSNAPILFFDYPAEFESPSYADRRYWDGAMAGMNNPVLAGITEAISYEATPDRIRVVSIGTAAVQLPPSGAKTSEGRVTTAEEEFLWRETKESSLLNDFKKAAQCITDDPPDSASFIAHRWLMGSDEGKLVPRTDSRLVRLNPLIKPHWDGDMWRVPRWSEFHPYGAEALSNASLFKALSKLEMDAVNSDEVALIQALCSAWMADKAANQSVHARGDMMTSHVGHATFSEALAAAKALMGLSD